MFVLVRFDAAVPQDLPDQEEAGQEDAPEPSHPLLDPHANRQHHPVQCKAQALAPHQAWILISFCIEYLLCLETIERYGSPFIQYQRSSLVFAPCYDGYAVISIIFPLKALLLVCLMFCCQTV
ncbi:hypothetical protein SEVIR_6G115160v4 [Setaria viridis]